MLTTPLILTLDTSWTYLSLLFSLLFCYLCLLESVGLEQHVHQPTHKRGHALDLIITRKVNEIIRPPPYVSDHGSVACSILAKVTVTRVRTELTYRKLRISRIALHPLVYAALTVRRYLYLEILRCLLTNTILPCLASLTNMRR